MFSKHLIGTALMGAVVLPLTLQGCSDDGSNPLCCTEFKVGAEIDANIGGSAQSKVAVQAVSDFAGIVSTAIEDLTTSCRGMAQDLGTAQADIDNAEKMTDRNAKMQEYCRLAVAAIGTVKAKASATIKLDYQPPRCSASISAKANCQASCSGSASCDVKANPPKCTGGSLQVSCKGECKAKAGASLNCTGTCTGNCTGSCTAKGGVACQGKCDGTCKGSAQGGTGEGIQADGTCKGTCEGTCEVTAPSAKCEGSCSGTCDASCTGTAEASVKCDGDCQGDFEPLKCEGGKLEGGCQVDAKCDANCDASVRAKAECTPPNVKVVVSGAADIQAAAKIQATLEANFGVVLSFQARLKGLADATGNIVTNVSAVTDIKAACIPPVVAAVKDAFGDMTDAVSVTGKLTASVGS